MSASEPSSDSSSGFRRQGRRRWRWHTPPALTMERRSLEASVVLAESADALGLLLWQTARDVYLWGRAEGAEQRRELFGAEAGPHRSRWIAAEAGDAGLRRALETAAKILSSPTRVKEETVSGACRAIAGWAAEHGMRATELEFAKAAAVCAPQDAPAALELARIARRQGETALADAWFRRTVVLGRRASDWESYAYAFLGLADLMRRRADVPGARQHLVRALRAARRHGLREIRAKVLHDLHINAAEAGSYEEASARGRRAVRAYGRGSSHLPVLALDVSRTWIARGAAGMAPPVLRLAEERAHSEVVRIALCGLLGRAAALTGDRDAYDRCWGMVLGHGTDAGSAGALLDLGFGAAALADWDRVRRVVDEVRSLVMDDERTPLRADLERLERSLQVQERPDHVLKDYVPDDADEGLQRDLVRGLRRTRSERKG